MIDARIMIISTRKICISPGLKKKEKEKETHSFLLLLLLLLLLFFFSNEYCSLLFFQSWDISLICLFFFFYKYRKIFWNINKNAHRRWNWRKANYAGLFLFLRLIKTKIVASPFPLPLHEYFPFRFLDSSRSWIKYFETLLKWDSGSVSYCTFVEWCRNERCRWNRRWKKRKKRKKEKRKDEIYVEGWDFT